jgi:hypothetical protein
MVKGELPAVREEVLAAVAAALAGA